MIRFFVPPTDIYNDIIWLSDEDFSHIRSLRLSPSEKFVVCDGAGTDYVCRLGERGGDGPRNGGGGRQDGSSHKRDGRQDGSSHKRDGRQDGKQFEGSIKHQSDGKQFEGSIKHQSDGKQLGISLKRGGRKGESYAEIVERMPSLGEPSVRCDLYIALAKGDRLDYAVQKSIELGAHKIVLFVSERCVSSPDSIEKKITRLQRISLETAKQSGRGIVPKVTAAQSFEAAVKEAALADLPLFCYEEERGRGLKEALSLHGGGDPRTEGGAASRAEGGAAHPESADTCEISIVTGPEGGFTPKEAHTAEDAGMIPVSLGPRILRCETAPAAVLAAVMYHTGNMGL